MIQFTEYMTFKKRKDQSVDVSVLLRRENKIITRGRGKKDLGRKEEGKGTRGTRSCVRKCVERVRKLNRGV